LGGDRGGKAAQVNLVLTRQVMTQGLVSVLQVLSAQEMYARAKSSHAQAKAAQRADTVLLFQALGGGWDSRRSSDPDRQTRGWTPMLTKVKNSNLKAEEMERCTEAGSEGAAVVDVQRRLCTR
jgi:hypothetical protein